jgi:CheY-like chemotaxis protein
MSYRVVEERESEPVHAELAGFCPAAEPIPDRAFHDAHSRCVDRRARKRTGRDASPSAIHQVLVVDDDADLRDLYKWTLGDIGPYCVTTAPNGLVALARLRQFSFDVVVTDFSMPVLDGCELVRRLMADQDIRTIPVVLVTALADQVPWDVRRSCVALLAKPCDPAELSSVISLAIAARWGGRRRRLQSQGRLVPLRQ